MNSDLEAVLNQWDFNERTEEIDLQYGRSLGKSDIWYVYILIRDLASIFSSLNVLPSKSVFTAKTLPLSP